jgi:hypothetical protein
LCGNSGGAQWLCEVCRVSSNRAPSGNRQRRQYREVVAAVGRQLVSDLCGDSAGAQQHCSLCRVSSNRAPSGNRQPRRYREVVALNSLFLSFNHVFNPLIFIKPRSYKPNNHSSTRTCFLPFFLSGCCILLTWLGPNTFQFKQVNCVGRR